MVYVIVGAVGFIAGVLMADSAYNALAEVWMWVRRILWFALVVIAAYGVAALASGWKP